MPAQNENPSAFPNGEKISRRSMLARLGRIGAALQLPLLGTAVLSLDSCGGGSGPSSTSTSTQGPFTAAQNQFLQKLESDISLFFWEQASSQTGMIKDHAVATGDDTSVVSSIASTGFGLTGLCIADSRGFITTSQAQSRVLTALQFLWSTLPNYHGYFYHFINMNTGAPAYNSVVSSIDTAILMCGVLTCYAYFSDPDITDLATKIYNRVDWPWMLNGGSTLSLGWTPNGGFLPYRWDTYSELMMLYLLGLGSPTYPLPASTWDAWTRPIYHYDGLTYIHNALPLFTDQYSQAWFDFRHKKDAYANYFQNSVTATEAHKLFCLSLSSKFPDYSNNLWGITSSDSAKGYVTWGGPPSIGPINGTVVPAAPGGSLAFRPSETIAVLQNMENTYGVQAVKRYGLVDAFNPLTGWYATDVIGIDVGITLLMAENARTQFVWNTFMKNAAAQRGMNRAGFTTTSS